MPEKKSLDSIQILRGMAALAVVVHHACTMVIENGSRPALLNQLGFFTDFGAAGVDVFFVISGFIMVFVSKDAFGKTGAAPRFWLKRLARVAPLYWIYTTVMLALVLSPFAMKHAVFSLPYTLKSYLFIPAFNPTANLTLPQPLLATGWTLCYEMFFYLIFGLWIWLGRIETIVPFVLACFAGSVIASRLLGMDTAIGAFLAQPIMFEFLYGVIVCYAFVRGGRPGRKLALGCVAAAAGVFALTIFVRPALEWRWLFWGLPAAVLVYGAAGLAVGKGAVSSAFVRLGDASYTLYLQHAFVTLTLGGLLKRGILVDRLPPDLLIVLTVVACVPLAWMGYAALERPMNQWLAGRLFAPRRIPAPETFPLTGINPAETEPGA